MHRRPEPGPEPGLDAERCVRLSGMGKSALNRKQRTLRGCVGALRADRVAVVMSAVMTTVMTIVLTGCIVVPQTQTVYDPECRMHTRQVTLQAAYLGGFHSCAGEGCVENRHTMRGGLLRHTEPTTESFRETGSWADRRKSRPYNLFYGDIEADIQARLAVWRGRSPAGRRGWTGCSRPTPECSTLSSGTAC